MTLEILFSFSGIELVLDHKNKLLNKVIKVEKVL